MALFRPASLLFCSVIIPTSLAAQPPPQRDPRALQILARAAAALGGLQLTVLSDMRLEGTIALPTSPDTVVATFVAKARGNDWSLETVRGTHRTSYRALNGFGSIKVDNELKRLPPHNTSGLPLDMAPLFGRWIEFSKDKSVVQFVGTANLDGTQCDQVHIEADESVVGPLLRNEHGKVDVFVESSTGLIAAILYRMNYGPSTTKTILVETRFSDYQVFQGFAQPTKVTRYLEEKPVAIFHVAGVRLNNGFGDADFHN